MFFVRSGLQGRMLARSALSGVARRLSTATKLPASVDVVVAGGGIVGAGTALGLAQLGKSVLVLEQNTLTSGSTWHAAGLVAQLKHCEAMIAMAKYASLRTDTVPCGAPLYLGVPSLAERMLAPGTQLTSSSISKLANRPSGGIRLGRSASPAAPSTGSRCSARRRC